MICYCLLNSEGPSCKHAAGGALVPLPTLFSLRALFFYCGGRWYACSALIRLKFRTMLAVASLCKLNTSLKSWGSYNYVRQTTEASRFSRDPSDTGWRAASRIPRQTLQRPVSLEKMKVSVGEL